MQKQAQQIAPLCLSSFLPVSGLFRSSLGAILRRCFHHLRDIAHMLAVGSMHMTILGDDKIVCRLLQRTRQRNPHADHPWYAHGRLRSPDTACLLLPASQVQSRPAPPPESARQTARRKRSFRVFSVFPSCSDCGSFSCSSSCVLIRKRTMSNPPFSQMPDIISSWLSSFNHPNLHKHKRPQPERLRS